MTQMYGPAAFRKRGVLAEVAGMYPACWSARAVALIGVRTHLWAY